MNIKIKPETLISVGLVGLSLVQTVLGQQKEAADKAKLKQEILEEVLKSATEESK